MVTGLIGKKIDQSQAFLEDGTRIPVSKIHVADNVVTQIKSQDHDGYTALQLGFESRKKATRAATGHSKKAGLQETPRFFREIRVDTSEGINLGTSLKVADVFKPGDIVDVMGVSKGKGYAGVVKRHHFRGGPRTHGQSDRERAPGSIGQTTTPGRVYKGKRMAGRMGNEQVTVKNLEIVDIMGKTLVVKGLIPGVRGGIVLIKKVGENKKFVPVFKSAEENIPSEEVKVGAQVETIEDIIEIPATEEKAKEDKTEKEK